MTRDEYIAECKALFTADRYGWSVCEEDAANDAYDDGLSPADAVYDMNRRYAVRRANQQA